MDLREQARDDVFNAAANILQECEQIKKLTQTKEAVNVIQVKQHIIRIREATALLQQNVEFSHIDLTAKIE